MTAPLPLTLCNLGAGPSHVLRQLKHPPAFDGWQELRIDIDPTCRPDIVADLMDLSQVVADSSVDLIYCSHVLEHFFDHQVPLVLSEFARILRPAGAAVMRLPDLALIFQANADFDLERVLYPSPSGPITVLDVIYGHRKSIAAGNHYMAHRTGFTEASLARRLLAAGFAEVQTRHGPSAEFCAVATRDDTAHAAQVAVLINAMGSPKGST
jgi:SAM-dependent methyltransferase